MRVYNLDILVVDDSANMRRTIKNMLRNLGAGNIFEADDGDTAWEKLKVLQVGLIICDWHMPRLPGVELLRRVRDDTFLRNVPFLMVTAEVSEGKIAQAAETEVDGYLLKPFMAKTLEEKIVQILRKKENPGPFEAHMKAGADWIEEGRYDEALHEFNQAIELRPDSARARNAVGDVYLKMGDKETAEKWLLEAVRANPQYIRAHESLGEFYIEENREDRALECLERAATISPHNPGRQTKLGKIYISRGEEVKADDAFKMALESDVHDADRHTEIGEIYLSSGKANKAAAAFKSSLDIIENVHVYNRLGIALRKKGRFEEAVTEYHKALKLDPQDEALHYNIGRAFWEMGRYDDSIHSLKQALHLDPEFAECNELLERVQASKWNKTGVR